MKEEHYIDRLFQESFKDFEVSPPDNAWGNIEKRLKATSKKRVIPLWRRITAAVAIIALLILAGSQWYLSPSSQNIEITDKTKIDKQNNNSNANNELEPAQNSNALAGAPTDDKDNNTSNAIVVTQENPDALIANTTDKQEHLNRSTESELIAMAQNENSYANDPIENNNLSTRAYSNATAFETLSSSSVVSYPQYIETVSLPDSDFDSEQYYSGQSLVEVANILALEDEKNREIAKEKNKPSWYIKPQISPVFYGNMASGSSIDPNLNQNSGEGQVDLSYGLNIAYQLSEKVKIRTGVNRVNVNYSTNDLFVLPGSDVSALSNVNSNSVIASVVTADQLDILEQTQEIGRQEAISSDLRQNIGFIEFPLELEYKLLDRKIGVNLIGGASTFLLNDNNLDIVNAQGTTTIGEATNINNLSFSTNIGLGFDYALSNRLLLNLEPTFKYQFNTFESGTTDFQPYFLGVYSGVIFKF